MKNRPLATVCLWIILLQVVSVGVGMWKQDPIPVLQEIKRRNGRSSVSAVGQVYRKEIRQTYQVLYLRDTEVMVSNKINRKLNILVYDESFQKVVLGNTVFVQGKGAIFDLPRNPGNFDQNFYYKKQGIDFLVFGDSVKNLQGEMWKIREMLQQFREKWHSMLVRILGETYGGMLSAMMTGEKECLDPESKELYQINGIGHLLAISGLHLSFIGLIFYQGLRKAGFSYTIAGIIGGTFLFLYTMMTGVSVSTIRALCMFLFRIGADISGRVYDMLTALLFSAMLIVVKHPYYLMDAGFWCSFGSILGIYFLVPIWKELMPKKLREWKQMLGEAFHVSFAIQLFLFPITIFFFFEIPLYAVFMNVLVIPLMSWVLGMGLLGSCLCMIHKGVGTMILQMVGILLRFYEVLCTYGARVPMARIVIGKPKWQQVILCYGLLLIFIWYVWRYVKKEGVEIPIKRKVRLLLILFGILLMSVPTPKRNGTVEITMLDVGQGDGIYVKGPTGVHYFVDGGSSDVKRVGRDRIEPFLKSQGVGTLDYVLISHGDIDHMGGIQEMLERQMFGIRIRNLVLPTQMVWDDALWELAEIAQKNGTKVLSIQPGQGFCEQKNFQILCLQPGSDFRGESGNSASMILKVMFDDFDALFTGDVEGIGEEELFKKQEYLESDVLKVAHHGSKYSTTEEILDLVKPKVALISAGKQNRYGHPHKEILQRLKKRGIRIYNTQNAGAVTIVTDGVHVDIEKSF